MWTKLNRKPKLVCPQSVFSSSGDFCQAKYVAVLQIFISLWKLVSFQSKNITDGFTDVADRTLEIDLFWCIFSFHVPFSLTDIALFCSSPSTVYNSDDIKFTQLLDKVGLVSLNTPFLYPSLRISRTYKYIRVNSQVSEGCFVSLLM